MKLKYKQIKKFIKGIVKSKKIMIPIIIFILLLISLLIVENHYFIQKDISNSTDFLVSDENTLLRAKIVKKGIFPNDKKILYYDLLINDKNNFSLKDSQKIAYKVSSTALKDYKVTDIQYHTYTKKEDYIESFTKFKSYLDEFYANLKKDNNIGNFSRSLNNGTISSDLSKEELNRKREDILSYIPLYKVCEINKDSKTLSLSLCTENTYNESLNDYGADLLYFLSKDILDYNEINCNVNIKLYTSTLDDTYPFKEDYKESNYWSYSLNTPNKIFYNSKLIISSNILNVDGENNVLNRMSEDELEGNLPKENN